jgi:hypothetical protein
LDDSDFLHSLTKEIPLNSARLAWARLIFWTFWQCWIFGSGRLCWIWIPNFHHQINSIVEPQGAGPFGRSRSWSRYTEVSAPAPGSGSN